MKHILCALAFLLGPLGWLGCASAEKGGFRNSIRQGDGELVYLICEKKVEEGQTKAKKLCFEPTEGRSPTANQEGLVLYCEERDGERVCSKQDNITCEFSKPTGSNIPKLLCQSIEDKEARSRNDQLEMNRAFR